MIATHLKKRRKKKWGQDHVYHCLASPRVSTIICKHMGTQESCCWMLGKGISSPILISWRTPACSNVLEFHCHFHFHFVSVHFKWALALRRQQSFWITFIWFFPYVSISMSSSIIIQYWVPALSLAHRDFSGFSESFEDMYRRLCDIQSFHNFMLKNIILRLFNYHNLCSSLGLRKSASLRCILYPIMLLIGY